MGSPYSVHRQVNRIHVIKSVASLNKVLFTVMRTMGIRSFEAPMHDQVEQWSPEWVCLRDILLAYRDSYQTNSRQTIFLEARYEWKGWEKFQRVIIFDNCRNTFEPIDDHSVAYFELAGYDVNGNPLK